MKTRKRIFVLIVFLPLLMLGGVRATASDAEDFFSAALSGDVTEVKRLLKRGVDVNARQEQGATALLLAVSNGHRDVVELLVEAGVDVDAQDGMGRSAIGFASATGQTEIVKLLIGAGADVNARDARGRTALMLASAQGTAEIVRMLIDAGADIGARDNVGTNAYMVAVYFGHEEIAKMLIPAGFRYADDGKLVHIHSGAVFEDTYDIFRRSDVTTYDELGKDVSVGYIFREESDQITVTIYVYPTSAGEADADLLRSHFQELKKNVFDHYSNVQLAVEREDTFAFPSGDLFGIWARLRLDMNNKRQTSFIYLFGIDGWFIAYRISYPETIGGKEGVSEAIDSIISSFDYSAIH
jgi:hypothetical protein